MRDLVCLILALLCVAARADTLPAEIPLTLSDTPYVGRTTLHYDGAWHLQPDSYFDSDGHPYVMRVQVRKTMPARPRLCIKQHASGGYKVTSTTNYEPVSTRCDVEIRNQDGQVKAQAVWEAIYGPRKSEWWSFDKDGVPAPQRRNAGAIKVVLERWPAIDIDRDGIIVHGKSLGGGGMPAALVMPDPYRAKIAYVRGTIAGFLMPRLVKDYGTISFKRLPPDSGDGVAWWDSWDFSLRAQVDPILRGIHYRHTFSTTDNFARSATGNSQVHWVNVLEANKLGGAATWVAPINGHSATEKGVNMPKVDLFEVAEQDVTLDRAHPAFTNSTGNWPLSAAQRIDVATYPRGHYNLGLTWDHAKIIDTSSEISIPIKYRARAAFGGGVPDQPQQITVDVTPRRPRNFVLVPGEMLRWQFGSQSGAAQVVGDTVTAVGLVVVSGQPYQPIRFFR